MTDIGTLDATAAIRQSLYTSAIPHEGGLLLYNAASGAFAVADEALAACYESCGGKHPELAKQLLAGRFLTTLSADEELDEQRRLFEAKRADPSMLKIAYGLTYACNCRCAYCYEQDKIVNKQRMTSEIVDAIFAFITQRFAAQPFSTLFIEWYGGEPTLCLDIISNAAAQLMAWCEANGVTYESITFSNGVLLDDEAAAVLAQAGVQTALLTIDGPRNLHNARRPAIGCDDPFERNLQAIAALQKHGIRVEAAMNTDKVNAARYDEIEEELHQRFNVHLNPAKLNDYAHSYGCAGTFGGPGSFAPVQDAKDANAGNAGASRSTDAGSTNAAGEASAAGNASSFGPPDFDLFTHPEFARQQFAWFAAGNPNASDILALLQPSANFCAGQLDNYFVIDAIGDVYKCDGWMGEPGHKLFNLLDDSRSPHGDDAPELHAITFDPFTDERCATCELLPLCWGNCIWERELTGWPCHPLKTTLPDYLRLLAQLS